MPKLFAKELCSNPFIVDGKPVSFECFPSNRGVLALDETKDAALIAALEDAAAKRRGGIRVLDQAAYDELKKNKGGSKVSAAFSKPEPLRVMKVLDPLGKPKAPASPAEVRKAALTPKAKATAPTAPVSRQDFTPATARVNLNPEADAGEKTEQLAAT